MTNAIPRLLLAMIAGTLFFSIVVGCRPVTEPPGPSAEMIAIEHKVAILEARLEYQEHRLDEMNEGLAVIEVMGDQIRSLSKSITEHTGSGCHWERKEGDEEMDMGCNSSHDDD